MAEQTSSGEHRKVSLYGGEIDVCDTCVNSLGYNITWEQAHPSIEQEARAAADARFPESPLAPENEQRAEDFYEGFIAGAAWAGGDALDRLADVIEYASLGLLATSKERGSGGIAETHRQVLRIARGEDT